MQQLNPDHPAGQIFAEQAVRQGMYYALNRAGMVKTANFGQGQVANSVEPSTSWAHNPNAKPVYGYNPSRANQSSTSRLAEGIGRDPGQEREEAAVHDAVRQRQPGPRQRGRDHAAELEGDRRRPHAEKHPVRAAGHRDHQHRDFDIILVGFNFQQDPDEAQLFSSAGTAAGGFNGFDSGTTRWTSS